MKISPSWKTTLVLTFLALAFTIGLTFTAVELPKLADTYLSKLVNSPRLATGQDYENEFKTQLYLKEYNLRLIGYISLGIILLLIITGFILNKKGLSSSAAILLFLPVFGHFAATMFFLGGLAFLRLLWFPFLDASFDIMKLGDIVLLPYQKLLAWFSSLGISLYRPLPFIITGLGIFIFILGTLAWFQSKIRKKKVTDFWLYRFSRHPQYLGWIIFSYGVMFLPSSNMKRSYSISSSLPWLLSTMIIIGVALFEELKMKKIAGEEYKLYQQKTPLLFPLPKFITALLKTPQRLFFKKKYFERKREILTFLVFYTVIFIVLSGFYSGLISFDKEGVHLSSQEMERIINRIKTTHSRIIIRDGLHKLTRSGEDAIEPLLSLLGEENPIIRWYTTDALSNFHIPEVIDALIGLLHDPEVQIRNAAAGSLGRIRAEKAVLPLLEAFEDPDRDMGISAARALASIGDLRAVAPLTKALISGSSRMAGAAAEALGNLGAEEAIPSLIFCLEERVDCPYNEVGQALLKLGSDRAKDAFIAGLNDERWWIKLTSLKGLAEINSPEEIRIVSSYLQDPDENIRRAVVWILRNSGSVQAIEPLKKALDDPDFEVRLYARDAIEHLKKQAGIN
ncbi:MAG: HEAT repeat domain-containing protein [Candidatus Aminicenantes bacterium]|nr:HEAT repeat domain-containing protein [Candidatus Aminicenantes bacterium]